MSKKPDERTNGSLSDVSEEEFAEGFADAVRRVIDRAHREGRSTSHVIDGELVRIYPDGRRESLGPVGRR